MNKLNKAFQINPLYEADGYKVGHKGMLAPNTAREYWHWVPRKIKYMHNSIDKIMSAGQQLVMRYIHSHFNEFFFGRPKEEALKFGQDMSKYLMMDYDATHFEELYDLGYLPIEVQSLPEGVFTNPNIPHMTGINTVDGYAWLGLYLETLFSKLAWQLPTTATIGYQFKKNAVEWVTKTDSDNLWLADFMCHDFHSRGGNPFTSIAAGLGHAFSNSGSDTLNVIPASRYYYDFDENDVPVYSVNASEHSVTCTGIFYYKKQLESGLLPDEIVKYYSFDVPSEGSIEDPDYLAIAEYLNLRDWLQKYPKGILSVVSDTFDLWKLITYILPRLKEEILARDGKLVIRPDSGYPPDIVCGDSEVVSSLSEDNLDQRDYQIFQGKYYKRSWERVSNHRHEPYIEQVDEVEPRIKGVVELLWDIFGGTETKEGYKLLDSHIGCIYGDAINLDKQVEIYTRLEAKRFAATNVVLGVGSYTYVMLTRDSAGYAAKGAWFETLENDTREEFNIFKDPATDNGTKKSLRGFQYVFIHRAEYDVTSGVTEEEAFSEDNELKTIYKDGQFFNQTTLTEIRERINESWKSISTQTEPVM